MKLINARVILIKNSQTDKYKSFDEKNKNNADKYNNDDTHKNDDIHKNDDDKNNSIADTIRVIRINSRLMLINIEARMIKTRVVLINITVLSINRYDMLLTSE
jgi:hypothetical protein